MSCHLWMQNHISRLVCSKVSKDFYRAFSSQAIWQQPHKDTLLNARTNKRRPSISRKKKAPVLLGPRLDMELNEFNTPNHRKPGSPSSSIIGGTAMAGSSVSLSSPGTASFSISTLEKPDVSGFLTALHEKDLKTAMTKLDAIAYSDELEQIQSRQCEQLLFLLSKQDRPDRDSVDLIKRIMRKRGFETLIDACNSILKIYSKLGDMNGMQMTLADMRRNGISATVETYNRILAVFPRSDFGNMLDFFSMMIGNGIQPNFETIHLLFIRCDKSHSQWAIEYFEQHRGELSKSDAIMNEILGIYAQAGKLAEAETLLQELQSSGRLSLRIATSMMNAYVACNEFDKVLSLMKQLESSNSKLDGLCYLPYMRALEGLGRVSEIPNLVSQLRGRGLVFTQSVFNYIFKLSAEQDWIDLSLSLASDCMKAHVPLKSSSLEALLDFCLRHGRLQDATVLAEHILVMKRPSVSALRKCMSAASITHDSSLLRRVWSQLESTLGSNSIDADLYMQMAECLMRLSDFEGALKYFNGAVERGKLSPDPIASFIVAAAEARKYELALKALKLLRDQSAEDLESVSQVIQRHSQEFERVLSTLCKQPTTMQSLNLGLENRRVALALYKQLILTNSPISERTFQIIMEAYRGEQDLIGVIRVWSSLISQYKKPKSESIQILLSACLSLGKSRTFQAIYTLIKKEQLDLSQECFIDLLLLGIKYGDQKQVLDTLFEMHSKSISFDLMVYKKIRTGYGSKGIPLQIRSFFEETYPEILEEFDIDVQEQKRIAQSLIPPKL